MSTRTSLSKRLLLASCALLLFGGVALAAFVGAVGLASGSPALAIGGYTAVLNSPTVPNPSDTYVWQVSGSKPGPSKEISNLTIKGCWGKGNVASAEALDKDGNSLTVEVKDDGSIKVTSVPQGDGDLPLTVTVKFTSTYPSGNDKAVVDIKGGVYHFYIDVGGPICEGADLKIIDQQVKGPTEIPVNKDVSISVFKVIHNNGPQTVTKARLTATLIEVPDDCTITPRWHDEDITNVLVSVDITIEEPFTIRCSKPSEHEFKFKNKIEILEPCGLEDPISSNNTAYIDWTVPVIAQADLEIQQSILGGPSDMDVSENQIITLQTVVKNNGLYGPVAIDLLETGLTAPSGCTAEPAEDEFGINCPPSQEMLKVGESKTIQQQFRIHCTEPSLHTFTSYGRIGIKEPHVVDPNPENNEASDLLSVSFWTKTDVKIVSQELLAGDCKSDAPNKIDMSVDKDVCLRKVLHNNGKYGPVDVSISAVASAPKGCSAVADEGNAKKATLQVSEDVVVEEVWTLHCKEPSTHEFTFDNKIEITTPHVKDTDPKNNVAPTEYLPVAVWVKTDVKIVSQRWVEAPKEIPVSESVQVTLEKVLHNNGPYGPVDVKVSTEGEEQVAVPRDCKVSLVSQSPKNPVSLAVGKDVVVTEVWSIHCEEPSTHEFEFENKIEIATTHVEDSDSDNNSAKIGLEVPVIAKADVKLTALSVDGPADIDVSETETIIVSQTLHNNGPYGPVTVLAPAFTIDAPDGCTAEPSLCLREVVLAVNVPQTVDCNVEIHCENPSTHTFDIDASVGDFKELHVIDPDPDNESRSTDYSVEVWGSADVKITDQGLVNPPDEIPVGEDVEFTLRKTLHNNGPYGPVDVSISASATGSSDCTISADSDNPTSASLPANTNVTIDEVWTVRCDGPSTHSFTFANSVEITTPHVRESDTTNNALSTTLSVAAIAEVDVEIVSQSLLDVPDEIPVLTDVDVTLRKTLHNYGPYGPVDVDIVSSADVSQASGCTITADSGNPASVTLPVSTDVVVEEDWTIYCTDAAGDKTFQFANSISAAEAHVRLADSAVLGFSVGPTPTPTATATPTTPTPTPTSTPITPVVLPTVVGPTPTPTVVIPTPTVVIPTPTVVIPTPTMTPVATPAALPPTGGSGLTPLTAVWPALAFLAGAMALMLAGMGSAVWALRRQKR